jgi:ubiquinone/menaquinone biosynthesis C-methylase UbiE
MSSDSPAMDEFYALGLEADRLADGAGLLELVRTQDIVSRMVPPPPGVVLDVGGGPGVYSIWLARRGYEVHLVDPIPLHIAQALHSAHMQPEAPLASARIGDARSLMLGDESVDAVLMLGPLYHLTEAADRSQALAEAVRVLRPGGVLVAAGISRFASTMDGLVRHLFDDPQFVEIANRDMLDGQHRNPSSDPRYFTTAYFHRPEELAEEVATAGVADVRLLGVEGPVWMLPTLTSDCLEPRRRDRLLSALRRLESEPSLVGASAHLVAVARKPG